MGSRLASGSCSAISFCLFTFEMRVLDDFQEHLRHHNKSRLCAVQLMVNHFGEGSIGHPFYLTIESSSQRSTRSGQMNVIDVIVNL